MTTAPPPNLRTHPATDVSPPAAASMFGSRLALAEQYASRLAGEGVARGVIGPREVSRLWARHLLNCAALTDLIPDSARVVDVGSGAGLPGIPMALRRSDLRLDLVESMVRRTIFLDETIEQLELTAAVQVLRGRVEDRQMRRQVGGAHWVVARAVAPLDRLVTWCLPLLAPGGRLLAMKGARAAMEIAEHQTTIRQLGAEVELTELATGVADEPTWVVVVQRSMKPSAGQ